MLTARHSRYALGYPLASLAPHAGPCGCFAVRFAHPTRLLRDGRISFGGYARVQSIAIKNKTTTLATEYARKGKNWKTELAQFEKEQQFLREHGIDK